MAKQVPRARFTPVPWREDDNSAPHPLRSELASNYESTWTRLWYPLRCITALNVNSTSTPTNDTLPDWVPLVRCTPDFPPELFEPAVSQLIHHPEYNSTLILRADIIAESDSEFPPSTPKIRGLYPVHNVHRRLLPRRPGRDTALEQHCTLYSATKPSQETPKPVPSVLVLTPIAKADTELPYYHPRVTHLAFRYIPKDLDSEDSEPTLQMEAIPLDDTPTDIDSRLYRTCLSLLETLNRYGWGVKTNYKKRVEHDCIISREVYQDFYLVMRERHKYLVDTWQEKTDPVKHVFEDIGIATYLMLLWKDMYATPTVSDTQPSIEHCYLKDFIQALVAIIRAVWMWLLSILSRKSLLAADLDNEPWKKWPRPPAGFLDIGCGNGLLTHILVAEGYTGFGVDVRARISWSHYPPTTQAQLRAEPLDPTELQGDTSSHPFFKPGVFIIGNHADELTPWVPVLATLCGASGFINIPCCPWTFDEKYERSSIPNFPTDTPIADFAEDLKLGGDGSNTSAYSMYRIWLGTLTHHCGWKIESESLRIPSTRNWALVGREYIKRGEDEKEIGKSNVQEIVNDVRERGIFKTRRPEGKAGDH